jgi:hypothetical protein
MQREFEVRLDNPIEVASQGELITADTVLLKAPTTRHRREASKIKSACMSAFRKIGESAPEEAKKAKESTDDSKLSAVELMAVMSQCDEDGTLMAPLFDAFRDMLLQGCGTISGEKITIKLFDDMALDDMENLFGEYVINFLLSSLLNSKHNRDGKN